MAILELYKNRGETPLECMERFRIQDSRFKNEKMTYAGRLDPMAEGLLLVITGEDIKNKDTYLGLDKEYEVDVLFGFATDTHDMLGLITECLCEQSEAIQVNLESGLLRSTRKDVQKILVSFVGRFSQKYPPYSSKYFNQAKSGELDDSGIASKEVEIKSIALLGQRTISKIELEKYVTDSIALVKGDFRQDEILESWKLTLSIVIPAEAGEEALKLPQDSLRYFLNEVIKKSNEWTASVRRLDSINLDPRLHGDDKSICRFPVITLRVKCTSGTYMRCLANEIGKKIGVPALALNIKRIRVGKYVI